MNVRGAYLSSSSSLSSSSPSAKRRKSEAQNLPRQLYIDRQAFNLLSVLGSGSFGVVYQARNLRTRELVALKTEPRTTNTTTLAHERKILHKLAGLPGVPRLRKFGKGSEGELALALDLCGPSLDQAASDCGGRFNLKTLLFLAPKLIRVVREVHERNFIHRDIKPDNFCLSTEGDRVLLIDFGLAKRYRDPRGKKHIPLKEGKALVGTSRYASLNAHLGLELSRRDDLESLGYSLVYLLKGRLPWQGLLGMDCVTKAEKIKQKKQSVSLFELCQAMPPEFESYLKYCRGLGFDETPNYGKLEAMFQDLFDRLGYVRDGVYDWSSGGK